MTSANLNNTDEPFLHRYSHFSSASQYISAYSGIVNGHICRKAMNPSSLNSFFNEGKKILISEVATGPIVPDSKRTVHLLILISIFPIIFVEL